MRPGSVFLRVAIIRPDPAMGGRAVDGSLNRRYCCPDGSDVDDAGRLEATPGSSASFVPDIKYFMARRLVTTEKKKRHCERAQCVACYVVLTVHLEQAVCDCPLYSVPTRSCSIPGCSNAFGKK
jgi:hypothetical protein